MGSSAGLLQPFQVLSRQIDASVMPLKPLVFETLLALSEEPRHGWSLVRVVQERLAGERILPGNFYRMLRRLLADGLIEVAPSRQRSDDERRRYFRLTARGERAAREEARRLQALVLDARTQKLLRAR
jgi:DNA-binding PadR family transcriptional regulator